MLPLCTKLNIILLLFLAGDWSLGGPRHKIIFSSRTHSQLSQAMGELAGMPMYLETGSISSVIYFYIYLWWGSVNFCDFSLGLRYAPPLGSIHTSFSAIVAESTSYKIMQLSRNRHLIKYCNCRRIDILKMLQLSQNQHFY
jgi:hypothetical protein